MPEQEKQPHRMKAAVILAAGAVLFFLWLFLWTYGAQYWPAFRPLPPPTRWHPFPNVHWSPEYLRQTADHADQLCVMMYDTALRYEKFYIALMCSWTSQLIKAVSDTRCELLFGLPAYDDADTGYHNPAVENLHSALSGCAAGLTGQAKKSFAGFAVYCEWEMTPEKWSVWQKFLSDH